VAKLGVEEWRDGTALYYWVSDPVLGSGPWVSTVVTPLMDVPFIVVIATWGVIALELLLAAALVASTSARRILLPIGLAFHVAIIFIHGITSFALVMCSVLILYLRSPAETFNWHRLQKEFST